MKSRVMKSSDIEKIAMAMSKRAMKGLAENLLVSEKELSDKIHKIVLSPRRVDDVIMYNKEIEKANELVQQARTIVGNAKGILCFESELPHTPMAQHGEDEWSWLPDPDGVAKGKDLGFAAPIRDVVSEAHYYKVLVAKSLDDARTYIARAFENDRRDEDKKDYQSFEVEQEGSWPNIFDGWREYWKSPVIVDSKIHAEVKAYHKAKRAIEDGRYQLSSEFVSNLSSARTTAAIIKAWPEMEQVLMDYYGEKEFVETPLSAVIDKYVRLALPAA